VRIGGFRFGAQNCQSKAALEGERKQVTVLFADVKGSMELAEQMDPEAWSAIMQALLHDPRDGVERFEGFVNKFTGDGIMALFGAPRTGGRRNCALVRWSHPEQAFFASPPPTGAAT
jgi:class 3 adenylate cyclase